MSTARPLRELPLTLFHDEAGSRPNKRPISPQSNSPQDHKRRLLSSSRLESPKFADQTNFTSILRGPDSPARVLDFGASKDADPERTPRSKGSQNTQLAPSPRLHGSPRTPTKASSSSVAKNPFDFARATQPTKRHLPTHPLVFDFVPRQLPPLVDPKSIHYPGFDVHRDPHDIVARLDTSRTLDAAMEVDEEEKENGCEPRSLSSSMALDIKPDSMIIVSPDKAGIRVMIDGTRQLTLGHKRIFGNGLEDDIVDYTMLSPRRSPRLARSAALLDEEPFGWRPRGGFPRS